MARAMGVFSDTTAFAYLAVTWFLVTLIASVQAARPAMRYAGAFAAAVMLQATAYATLSRSMLANAAAAVLTVPFLRLGSGTKRGAVKLAVALSVCFVALVVVGAAALPKLAATALKLVEERVFGALGSVGHGWEGLNTASSLRLEIWNTYLPFFWENPLTGIGYKALWIQRKLPPDNSYLGTLVETGMLGAVTMLSFLILVTRGLLSAGRQAEEASLFMALWVGLLVHAFFADVFTFWGTMPSVFVLIGTALQYGVHGPGERVTNPER
jgi:O-antigen ligase